MVVAWAWACLGELLPPPPLDDGVATEEEVGGTSVGRDSQLKDRISCASWFKGGGGVGRGKKETAGKRGGSFVFS